MPKYGTAITDEDLLSQLNNQSFYGEAVNDPDVIAQLEGRKSKVTNPFAFALPKAMREQAEGQREVGKNVLAGFLNNLKESAQPVAALINPENYPIDLKKALPDFTQPFNPFSNKAPEHRDEIQALANRFNINSNPYNAVGVEEKPFSTPEGKAQTIGEFGPAAIGMAKLLAESPAMLAKLLRRGKISPESITNFGRELPENYSYHNPSENPQLGVQATNKEGQPIPLGEEGQEINLPGRQNFEAKVSQEEPSWPPKATFKNTESEVNKNIFQVPETLQPRDVAKDSEVLAQQLGEHLTQGKELEEQGKEAATHLKNTFVPKEANAKQKYNLIWTHPDVEGRKFEASSFEALRPEFPENTDVNNALEKYRSDKSLQNMHDLKQEIGAEGAWYKNQSRFRSLTPEERRLKSLYDKSYAALSKDINTNLSAAAPDLEDTYADATSYWLKEVRPYLADKDLKAIVKGNITNPTTSQFKSIFKNPEPDEIGKVAQDIGEVGRNKIVHLATGLLPEENDLASISKAHNALRKSGLSSYLSPEFQANIAQAKTLSKEEKAAEVREAQKPKLIAALRKEWEKNQPKGEALEKFNPEKERQTTINFYQKQIDKEREALQASIVKSREAQAKVEKNRTTANKEMAAKTKQDVNVAQAKIDLLKKSIIEAKKNKSDATHRIVKGLAQEAAYQTGGLPAYIVAKNILK
jgi:hypothetical protein